MDVAIRRRNIEVSTALRDTVEAKVGKLGRFLDGMDRAEVRFTEERNPRIAEREVCEMTMHGHGHVVRARATGAEVLVAFDRAAEKLEHQLVKLNSKLVGRSHPRHAPAPRPTPGATLAEDPGDATDGGRIVRTKQFSIKPMTPEDALVQLDLLGHAFYLFTNSETDAAAVVYRRRDGHAGLIEAL